MRNGAWQPLACTRLPECNFPVITLPNFSASVKDHLLTQWSQARAARRRGPSLRIIFNRRRKHIRSFLSGMCRVPKRQARGPAGGSHQPGAGAAAPATPSRPHTPRRSLPATSLKSQLLPCHPSWCQGHSHPHSQGQPLRFSPVGSVRHSRDIYRVTYTVTCPASQALQFYLLKPSPTGHLVTHPQPCHHPPWHSLTDASLTALSCHPEQS